MRPQAVIIVTLAVLGVLAALPLGKGDGGAATAGGSSSWPCCDYCGICNRKFPPECQCNDISVRGCHPECKNCVKIGVIPKPPPGGGGPGPVVTYRCEDMLTNFCKNRCTPAPAPGAAVLS